MTKFYPPANKYTQNIHRACREGNLQLVLDFLNSDDSKQYLAQGSSLPVQMLIFAAMNGHLNICEAIWNAPQLNHSINNSTSLKNLLSKAFDGGNIDVIKFFEQKLKDKKVNYNTTFSSSLISATKNGNLKIVQHFLLDNAYNDILHLEFISNSILYSACGHNQLDILQFLLETKGIKEKYNIYGDNDCLFRLACENETTDIIKYLIFDLKIEQTDCIKDHLQLNTHKFEYITNWFEVRDLKASLNKELSSNEENKNNKKLKV